MPGKKWAAGWGSRLAWRCEPACAACVAGLLELAMVAGKMDEDAADEDDEANGIEGEKGM